jgi:hypothetical protein
MPEAATQESSSSHLPAHAYEAQSGQHTADPE